MPIHRLNNQRGFTLLEIIVALFIFSLVSVIAVTGLHSVLSSQSAAEKKAERLASLQTALLLLSRDVSQTINRPATNPSGQPDGFIGTDKMMIFTHAGFDNPDGQLQRSTLQRIQYQYTHDTLTRSTLPVLDLVVAIKPDSRELLDQISALRFEYLDHKNHFQTRWPPPDQPSALLPLAVRITMTLRDWGTLQQLYLIAGQPLEKPGQP